MSLRRGFNHLREYLRFLSMPDADRALVVYSEGPAYWPHLGPVVQALLLRPNVPLAYVSSSPEDPGLGMRHERLQTFQIGDGPVRTLFFQSLKARCVLLTMPDLGRFQLKRSPDVGAYVYLHHSLVSLHMVYREHAFDAYDVMLCAGPHHVAEMLAIAKLHGLAAPPRLVQHGYARVDALMAAAAAAPTSPADCASPTVIVAPSWGPEGLLERHAEALMAALAHCRWQVHVRPHPQTLRLAPSAMAVVRAWCRRAPNLKLDEAVSGHASLLDAQVMVSDWSGAAFDFALGLGRPVLFVDVPRKVNNVNYAQVDLEPVEVSARSELGLVLAPDRLADLPRHLDALLDRSVAAQAEAWRARWLHHAGRSAEAAVQWIVDELRANHEPSRRDRRRQ